MDRCIMMVEWGLQKTEQNSCSTVSRWASITAPQLYVEAKGLSFLGTSNYKYRHPRTHG